MTAYRPTPELPDAEGEGLLQELNRLCGLIDYDPEKGKKRRLDSYERRWALTALQKAILDAANRFRTRESFSAWLCQNHCEHIEACDPLRSTREVANAIHDLKWEVDALKDHMKDIDKLITMIVLRLPPERADAKPEQSGTEGR